MWGVLVHGLMMFVCEVIWWCVGPGTSDVSRWELWGGGLLAGQLANAGAFGAG